MSSPVPPVRIDVRPASRGDVLVLTIDNPPVNASSAAVRAGLLDGIRRLADNPALVAGVIIGARGTFVSGSDITEFDGPVPEPLLPTVIAAIEACPRPVVAALDGFALGGGLELALGCDYRIGSPGVRLGMPEVSLGMVPGAGGTQRLPRLVGPVAAIRLILTGRRISGAEGLALGLLDETTEADLLGAAVEAACRCSKRPTSGLPVPPVDEALFAAAVDDGMRTSKQRPNAADAVELVRMAGSVPVGAALAEERARFDRLRVGAEAAALRHIFFAERAAARRSGIRPSPTALRRTAVIGAGAMGSGIAAALARSGAEVMLIDVDTEQAARGRDRARQSLERAVARGLLDTEQAARGRDRARQSLERAVARGLLEPETGERAASGLSSSGRMEDLAGAELVVEAVFEDAAVKAAVLVEAQRQAPSAVLVTNTSYLGVASLAAALPDPAALIGLHFFNPADVMRLVEVVPTALTAPETVSTVLRLVADMDKQPVLAGDREGFIGNRLFAAYRRHAEYLIEDGALPADVDRALEGFGFALGPFAVADLSGLQIAHSLRERLRREGRLPARYVDIPDMLVDQGRLGRRTSAGYYAYDEKGRRTADPAVDALVLAESARKGLHRRPIGPDEIVRRAVGALVVEGCRAVADGTARHIDDVDVVMVNGFGFPRHLGGPMHWARQLPEGELATMAGTVAQAAQEAADPALVLACLADEPRG